MGENAHKWLFGGVSIVLGAMLGVVLTYTLVLPPQKQIQEYSPVSTPEEATRRAALENYLAAQAAAASSEPTDQENQDALEKYLRTQL